MSDSRDNEREALAPPPASIPPSPVGASRPPAAHTLPPPARATLRPPPSAAPAGPGATPPRSRFAPSTSLLVGSVVVLGVADFALALRRWVALPLSALLTLLLLPWAIAVVRDAGAARHERAARAIRGLVFHLANIVLVLAFVAAKWITLVDALSGAADDASSYVGAYRNYTAALVVLLLTGAGLRGGRVARWVATSADRPARLMMASFGLLGVLGGLLLALPVSLQHPADVSLVDALFVAVSAVCVTGLSTVNVADTYTLAGQGIICALIQVGGLGIMVITAAVTMFAGRRLGVKGSAALAQVVDSRSLGDVRRTVTMIIGYTLAFETLGAALLYLRLDGLPQIVSPEHASGELGGPGSAEWAAVFHAVSAFCNAGFSNFRAGMAPFVADPLVCGVVEALVVLGGLGFPVVHELLFWSTHRLRGRRPPRITLNTRVALATTGMLLGGVALAYLLLEGGASFSGLGVLERANAAVFHSVVARTAGFSMIDVGDMRPATLLLTCFAMFVGGGSGSIAGGIKVTTLAVLFATFRGELRGQPPRLFDRAIPDAVVRRAMGVGFLATLLVVGLVFVLLLVDDHEPLAILFETVSAFSTTGLSTGITPGLSLAAKLVLVVTMLVGRIGPLTAAVALSARARPASFQHPEERVMIG